MKIAVLIPCLNEEATVAKVVNDFRKQLSNADIFVFDNDSSDNSAKLAHEAGAIVRVVKRKGKGAVVRQMFRSVDADVYVMVDADDTYMAEDVQVLVDKIVKDGYDMAVADRLSSGGYDKQNTRALHGFGNRLVRFLTNSLFDAKLNDIMSGYRAFSKAFVKNTPILVDGFEVETVMTLHALDKKFSVVEVQSGYRDRPKGSHSKLKTFEDGAKVLKTIAFLFKDYRPLAFFGFTALFFCILGLLIGSPVIYEYIQTAYIKKVPSAILATGLELLASIFFVCALVLDSISKSEKERIELSMYRYLEKNV